ncbi:hypothetical protein RJ47_13985 [Vibrio sinaloensis]|nr:hypothetical protein RJ47_13985 [Vibrio sinaloensis]
MLQRSSGYHTFFSSSASGLLLAFFASLLYYWLVSLGYNSNVENSVGKLFLERAFLTSFDTQTVAMFEISFITLILSQILPWLAYLPFNKKALLREEFFNDAESPEFTKLFYRSSLTGVPVLFTLSDRKVYIGYIYEIPTKPFTDIYVLPLFSGYRCKDELRLKKVTPYKPVIDSLEAEEKKKIKRVLRQKGYKESDTKEYVDDFLDQRNIWADFIIALPLREIVHAHLHDFAHENMFHKHEAKEEWNELGNFKF